MNKIGESFFFFLCLIKLEALGGGGEESDDMFSVLKGTQVRQVMNQVHSS